MLSAMRLVMVNERLTYYIENCAIYDNVVSDLSRVFINLLTELIHKAAPDRTFTYSHYEGNCH